MDKLSSAIVLAAGRGSRMGELTRFRPKCLCILGGRSLLEWQLAALENAGIRRVTLIAGYRFECLTSMDCTRRPEVTVIENPRWQHTNMVASLLYAKDILCSEPCIVSYGDIVYHPGNVRALCRAAGDIAITYDRLWYHLWRARFRDVLSEAETFRVQEGRVVEIGRRPQELNQIQGQYMGLLRFAPAGWKKVEEVLARLPQDRKEKIDFTSLIQLLIGSGIEVTGLPVDGRWCEVDQSKDLTLYENRLRNAKDKKAWSHDWRW